MRDSAGAQACGRAGEKTAREMRCVKTWGRKAAALAVKPVALARCGKKRAVLAQTLRCGTVVTPLGTDGSKTTRLPPSAEQSSTHMAER